MSCSTLCCALTGIPAAGKSTLVRHLRALAAATRGGSPSHRVIEVLGVLELDELFLSLPASTAAEARAPCGLPQEELTPPTGVCFSPTRWKAASEALFQAARKVLQDAVGRLPVSPAVADEPPHARILFVVDNMHYASMRRRYWKLACDVSAEALQSRNTTPDMLAEMDGTRTLPYIVGFLEIFLDPPLLTCLQRNSMRRRGCPDHSAERTASADGLSPYIPPGVIESMHAARIRELRGDAEGSWARPGGALAGDHPAQVFLECDSPAGCHWLVARVVPPEAAMPPPETGRIATEWPADGEGTRPAPPGFHSGDANTDLEDKSWEVAQAVFDVLSRPFTAQPLLSLHSSVTLVEAHGQKDTTHSPIDLPSLAGRVLLRELRRQAKERAEYLARASDRNSMSLLHSFDLQLRSIVSRCLRATAAGATAPGKGRGRHEVAATCSALKQHYLRQAREKLCGSEASADVSGPLDQEIDALLRSFVTDLHSLLGPGATG